MDRFRLLARHALGRPGEVRPLLPVDPVASRGAPLAPSAPPRVPRPAPRAPTFVPPRDVRPRPSMGLDAYADRRRGR